MSWDALRIALLYGPVWVIIGVTIAIYIRVGLHIYSNLKQLRALGMTGDWTDGVNQIADASTAEMYEIRPASSRTFQDHSQADESGPFREQIISQHSINTHSSQLVRVDSDPNMAAWAYARYSFLFFIALLITWVE